MNTDRKQYRQRYYRAISIMISIVFLVAMFYQTSGIALVTANAEVCDSNMIVAENIDINTNIPTEVTQYAKIHFTEMYGLVDSDYDTDDLQLGEAYVVYNADESKLESIYHFPISENKKIEAVLTVIETDSGCVASISNENVDVLNTLEKKGDLQEYIQYDVDGELYIEGEEGIYKIDGGKKSKVSDEEKRQHRFFKRSIKSKIQELDEAYQNIKEIAINISAKNVDSMVGYSPAHTTTTSGGKTETRLNIKKYLTPQGSDPICWAAAIATIKNYRQGSNTSAKSVCNAIGHAISGGTPSDVQRAFNYYGLRYRYKNSNILWSDIKLYIEGNHPIYIEGTNTSSGSRHASVITGVRRSNEMCFVRIYNPQNTGKSTWNTFSGSSTQWPNYTGAAAYKWDRTGYYNYC